MDRRLGKRPQRGPGPDAGAAPGPDVSEREVRHQVGAAADRHRPALRGATGVGDRPVARGPDRGPIGGCDVDASMLAGSEAVRREREGAHDVPGDGRDEGQSGGEGEHAANLRREHRGIERLRRVVTSRGRTRKRRTVQSGCCGLCIGIEGQPANVAAGASEDAGCPSRDNPPRTTARPREWRVVTRIRRSTLHRRGGTRVRGGCSLTSPARTADAGTPASPGTSRGPGGRRHLAPTAAARAGPRRGTPPRTASGPSPRAGGGPGGT